MPCCWVMLSASAAAMLVAGGGGDPSSAGQHSVLPPRPFPEPQRPGCRRSTESHGRNAGSLGTRPGTWLRLPVAAEWLELVAVFFTALLLLCVDEAATQVGQRAGCPSGAAPPSGVGAWRQQWGSPTAGWAARGRAQPGRGAGRHHCRAPRSPRCPSTHPAHPPASARPPPHKPHQLENPFPLLPLEELLESTGRDTARCALTSAGLALLPGRLGGPVLLPTGPARACVHLWIAGVPAAALAPELTHPESCHTRLQDAEEADALRALRRKRPRRPPTWSSVSRSFETSHERTLWGVRAARLSDHALCMHPPRPPARDGLRQRVNVCVPHLCT